MESATVVAASGMPVAHESRIAGHMARHALLIAPVVILACGLLRGVDGAISAAIGLVLVALNFLVSARLIAWASERSLALLQGAVLGGFVVRLFALTLIVLGLEQFSFIDLPVLVLTIAVTHIALLIWETRYVSLTLAAPGLKPGVGEREPKDREQTESHRDGDVSMSVGREPKVKE
jgi:hypothetical protein